MFVFDTPLSLYESLVASGGIIPDPDPLYSSHSFIVTPDAIAEFVAGSTVSFVSIDSVEFYEDFY